MPSHAYGDGCEKCKMWCYNCGSSKARGFNYCKHCLDIWKICNRDNPNAKEEYEKFKQKEPEN